MRARYWVGRAALDEVRRWSAAPRPAHVAVLRLPARAAADTWRALRARASAKVESLVLWVGQPASDGAAWVTGLVLPEVDADSQSVRIRLDDRLQIADWMARQRMRVLAELHSHPGPAFLSPVDARYPMVATLGSIQIVVPRFAVTQDDWDHARIFELTEGGWTERPRSVLLPWEAATP